MARGKHYVSQCLNVEVSSFGDTIDKAVSNLKEAVELYLINAKELNMIDDLSSVLKASSKFTSTIEVEI